MKWAVLIPPLVLLPLASTVDASSAWPRGKGKVFASVSWSTWGDIIGYTEAIQEPWIDEPPILEQTEEISFFGEFGLSDRVTVGIDNHRRADSDIGETILFLRTNLGALDWPDKFSLQIGAGPSRDWQETEQTAYRVGFGWGRGFDTRWGGAWTDIDAKYTALPETDTNFYKLDATIGLNTTDKAMWYLQVQSGAVDDNPAFVRLVPTYVRRIGYGMSLESALLWGVENDEAQGVKFSAWFEF
ncbi:hypothetical protein [Tropicimonas sp.]|uniref:hypothetical protein n=1 Tax=Tropicimonas sp. TaxID=2067044 RepID=UPI003A897C12